MLMSWDERAPGILLSFREIKSLPKIVYHCDFRRMISLIECFDGKWFLGKIIAYVCNQEIQQQRYKMMLCFTIIKVRDQTIWWWKRFCFAITSFLRGPTLGYSLFGWSLWALWSLILRRNRCFGHLPDEEDWRSIILKKGEATSNMSHHSDISAILNGSSE